MSKNEEIFIIVDGDPLSLYMYLEPLDSNMVIATKVTSNGLHREVIGTFEYSHLRTLTEVYDDWFSEYGFDIKEIDDIKIRVEANIEYEMTFRKRGISKRSF